jgi:hypothetical protein
LRQLFIATTRGLYSQPLQPARLRRSHVNLSNRAGKRFELRLNRVFPSICYSNPRIPELREAIEDSSKGRTVAGFDKLDKFGVIHEIADDVGRLAAIAEKQMDALKAQKSSLIIAPTHASAGL